MRNQKLGYLGIVVTTFVLVVGLLSGLYISNEITKASTYNLENQDWLPAKYHVMILVNNEEEAYRSEFVKGIEAASKDWQMAYEIVKIPQKDYDKDLIDAIDMAIYAQVNGIIIDAVNSQSVVDKIRQAIDLGIPVVTLNEDLPQSKRTSYVGADNYKLGRLVGQAFYEALEGEGRIGIIEKSKIKVEAAIQEQVSDLLLLGLTDFFLEHPKMHVETIGYTETGILGAETVATNMLKEYPTINGIFCSDEKNTLGVIQVLLDNNLVNEIVLVGAGDDEEILAYLERGNVVESTMIKDDYDIGYQAMQAIHDGLGNLFVPSYMNTESYLLTHHNIKEYLYEKSQELEKQE